MYEAILLPRHMGNMRILLSQKMLLNILSSIHHLLTYVAGIIALENIMDYDADMLV